MSGFPVIVAVVGNPRAESRTHALARGLVSALTEGLPAARGEEVDLAELGSRVLEQDDPAATAAVERVLAADLLVLASPTYKATYSGLLKAFLDRLGTGALDGKTAVPILLGGAQNHRLAIDVHFAPLLLELAARVPARGLFVLESEVADFPALAEAWVAEQRPLLLGALGATTVGV